MQVSSGGLRGPHIARHVIIVWNDSTTTARGWARVSENEIMGKLLNDIAIVIQLFLESY